ncbi:hypothetical protein [Nostoc sp.]|uniref:hypothetical protein n=1 Tax=Nostoc sp. TaxID=1180 RepID=UPI002FF8E362
MLYQPLALLEFWHKPQQVRLVDASRHKRLLIAIATLAVEISYIVIVNFSALPAVVAAQAVISSVLSGEWCITTFS